MRNLSAKKNLGNAGFTLAELLVSIAIMVIVLTLIVVNYRKFDSTVVLTNLAYDMGLSVRKAQTYGISVKGKTSGVSQNFTYPYGIAFNVATPQQYILFVDVEGNGLLNNHTEEDVEFFKLRSPYQITSLCVLNPSDQCQQNPDLNELYITFERPNPDAHFESIPARPNASAVKIDIGSSQDPSVTRSIIIRTTGQISVQ